MFLHTINLPSQNTFFTDISMSGNLPSPRTHFLRKLIQFFYAKSTKDAANPFGRTFKFSQTLTHSLLKSLIYVFLRYVFILIYDKIPNIFSFFMPTISIFLYQSFSNLQSLPLILSIAYFNLQ